MTEEMHTFQEELSSERSVAKLTQKYQVYFIHAIHPTFSPGNNTLLNPKVDWKTKLDILLSLTPTISTSTIQPEENERYLWSRIGVVLSGGSVNAAYSVDVGTQARSLNSRNTLLESRYESTIEQAIHRTGPRAGIHMSRYYNEIVVSNPKIAGFFICLDAIGHPKDPDLPPYNEIVSAVMERALPLFIMIEGELYRPKTKKSPVQTIDLLQKIKGYTEDKGNEIAAEKIQKQGWQKINHQEIPKINYQPEDKDVQVIKILNKHVFDLITLSEKLPWISHLLMYGQGRMAYIEVVAKSRRDSFKGEKTKYKGIPDQTTEDSRYYPTKGQEVFIIDSFFVGDINHKYLIWNGELFDEQTDYIHNNISLEQTQANIRLGLCYSMTRIEGFLPNDPQRYLTLMNSKIENVIKNIQEYEQEGRSYLINNSLHSMGQYLAHVLGFAKEAKHLDDIECFEKAEELISRYTNLEEFKRSIEVKLKPSGEIKLTLEDLI